MSDSGGLINFERASQFQNRPSTPRHFTGVFLCIACENSHSHSLLHRDGSQGGTSATQRQKIP